LSLKQTVPLPDVKALLKTCTMSTLQTKADVADLLKTSTRRVSRLGKLGRLPNPLRPRPNKALWKADDLESFLAALA
jgi:hypothetical protein